MRLRLFVGKDAPKRPKNPWDDAPLSRKRVPTVGGAPVVDQGVAGADFGPQQSRNARALLQTRGRNVSSAKAVVRPPVIGAARQEQMQPDARQRDPMCCCSSDLRRENSTDSISRRRCEKRGRFNECGRDIVGVRMWV